MEDKYVEFIVYRTIIYFAKYIVYWIIFPFLRIQEQKAGTAAIVFK